MTVTGQIKSCICDAFGKKIQHELAVGLCDEFDFSFSLDFDKTIILLHPVPFI